MPVSDTIAPTQVSIRLLGGASVDGLNGPIAGRGTRGHRLGLLALLAAARGKTVTRDKLVAMLWPEAASERARPLLSDALYLVRGSLGDDAVLGSGDELWLNSDCVTSDLETFDRLYSAGDFALAVDAHGGPFLDGFHISDASEFERWIEAERRHVAAKCAGALATLAAAEENERKWTTAISWLRRLAAHDPYDGDVARRLMLALAASGNRAAALQHARIHAALLREDFDTEPDRAVLALVDELTAASSAGEPTRQPERRTTAPAPDEITAPGDAVQPPPGSPIAPPPPMLISESRTGERRRATDHPEVMASAPDSPRWWRRASVHIALAGFLAVVSLLLLTRSNGPRRIQRTDAPGRASSLAPKRSIAVLPFTGIGPDSDDAWFSDGLTEEVIGLLGRVDGLHVAARSSAFALRDSKLEARSLGDTLHVATLLEGSVRRVGERVRVSARLVDAANGYQLWSRNYDRTISDVVALQQEIASAIVAALQLTFDATERSNVPRASSRPDAYDLYLRGIHARNRLTRDRLAQSLRYFDRALRIDSTYAPAWAGKATAIGPMIWYGHVPRTRGAALMRNAARRAVALDAALPAAHIALGMVHFFLDWNVSAAEQAFRRAIALNPSDPEPHHFLANVLNAAGRFEEGLANRQRALALDPLSVRTEMSLGADFFSAGRYDEAAAHYRRASELEPTAPPVLGQGPALSMGLGHIHERQGNHAAAISEYLQNDSLRGISPVVRARFRTAYAQGGIRGYWRSRAQFAETVRADPVYLAWMWSRAGETERTVRYIQRAFAERNMALVYLGVLSDFAEARRDPRVQSILRVLRVPSRVP